MVLKMARGQMVIVLLSLTVLAPIVLYTDKLGSYIDTSSLNTQFVDDLVSMRVNQVPQLNAISNEIIIVKEPTDELHLVDPEVEEETRVQSDNSSEHEHKTRVLSAADEVDERSLIQQVTKPDPQEVSKTEPNIDSNEHHPQEATDMGVKEPLSERSARPIPDIRVRQLRDQLIRAKVYLSLGSARSHPQFVRELRARIKDVQRSVGESTKDSELPRNVHEKLREMERILERGKQIQDGCTHAVKKLRAILHSAEEQLNVHKKQELFLTQLAAKTLPKGLHCLPLRLSTDFYSLNHSRQEFPNHEKLENPNLYHYALFSDNVLAAATVVNSTIKNALNPADHVFHVVTNRLNYAAMRMWFLVNPPGDATIQVQNLEDFTWLNASYSPVLKQLSSASMRNYYFNTTHRKSDPSSLKYRNPKYLSILNHLRFYLPEIFPKLDKVLFLDDDVVVQKDLTGLWKVDLHGKVNGAVETCGENFHRFDRYLNFSNPLISKNFDPHACGWAYGMNVFDLKEWRLQGITQIYHSWQNQNNDRLLWKLGTLPPGLITFYNRTHPLDKSWHVLGLGYNPTISRREIERAAVIHYNGNLKPWLEIGIPKFHGYWSKFLDYDQPFLRECNINP
ncbi:Glycosyltransferase [Zostera marina]|uniref:Hexosyltransferase n=1 Tax=Zostera marina TaxID=29655 RepID=A0A0K9Q5D2_ZOSMR|nr:Glycosyltransferase [Zostera marina]